jgi:hypothetical protein
VRPYRYDMVTIDGKSYLWPVYKAKTSNPNWRVQYRMRVENPKPFWIVLENNGLNESEAAQLLVDAFNEVTKPRRPYKLNHTTSESFPGEFNDCGFSITAYKGKEFSRRTQCKWHVIVTRMPDRQLGSADQTNLGLQ